MAKKANSSRIILAIVVAALCGLALAISSFFLFGPRNGTVEESNTMTVVFETSLGKVELELDREKAPQSVDNFLAYLDEGFYNDTIFHRVIPGFVVQGGGFDESMAQKPTKDPIKNESDNGLSNARGTIAMARTSAPDSATSQFYINLKDNAPLDGAAGRPGYAVFGKVSKGMDVIDNIARQQTTTRGGHRDVPQTPILVKKAHRK